MINTNNDLISRKAAIDALKHDAEVLGIEPFDEGYTPFDAIQTLHDLSSGNVTNTQCDKCSNASKCYGDAAIK